MRRFTVHAALVIAAAGSTSFGCSSANPTAMRIGEVSSASSDDPSTESGVPSTETGFFTHPEDLPVCWRGSTSEGTDVAAFERARSALIQQFSGRSEFWFNLQGFEPCRPGIDAAAHLNVGPRAMAPTGIIGDGADINVVDASGRASSADSQALRGFVAAAGVTDSTVSPPAGTWPSSLTAGEVLAVYQLYVARLVSHVDVFAEPAFASDAKPYGLGQFVFSNANASIRVPSDLAVELLCGDSADGELSICGTLQGEASLTELLSEVDAPRLKALRITPVVTLYPEPGFGGSPQGLRLAQGEVRGLDARSIRIPPGAALNVCSATDPAACRTASSSSDDVVVSPEDVVSVVPAVTLYERAYFGGESVTLTPGHVYRASTTPDLERLLPLSARVSPGLAVTVCSREDVDPTLMDEGRADCKRLTGDFGGAPFLGGHVRMIKIDAAVAQEPSWFIPALTRANSCGARRFTVTAPDGKCLRSLPAADGTWVGYDLAGSKFGTEPGTPGICIFDWTSRSGSAPALGLLANTVDGVVISPVCEAAVAKADRLVCKGTTCVSASRKRLPKSTRVGERGGGDELGCDTCTGGALNGNVLMRVKPGNTRPDQLIHLQIGTESLVVRDTGAEFIALKGAFPSWVSGPGSVSMNWQFSP